MRFTGCICYQMHGGLLHRLFTLAYGEAVRGIFSAALSVSYGLCTNPFGNVQLPYAARSLSGIFSGGARTFASSFRPSMRTKRRGYIPSVKLHHFRIRNLPLPLNLPNRRLLPRFLLRSRRLPHSLHPRRLCPLLCLLLRRNRSSLRRRDRRGCLHLQA